MRSKRIRPGDLPQIIYLAAYVAEGLAVWTAGFSAMSGRAERLRPNRGP